jgi:micrococcal nuclease
LAVLVCAVCVVAACEGVSRDSESRAGDVGKPPSGDETTVERHVDGDALWVRGEVRVRLIGVDTPETKHPQRAVECFGKEASTFLGKLIPIGTEVRLVYDVERLDRYGRTLAYLYRLRDGLFVNAELLREGYAQAYTVPPNVAHADEFIALQMRARESRRGLWGACDQDFFRAIVEERKRLQDA